MIHPRASSTEEQEKQMKALCPSSQTLHTPSTQPFCGEMGKVLPTETSQDTELARAQEERDFVTGPEPSYMQFAASRVLCYAVYVHFA